MANGEHYRPGKALCIAKGSRNERKIRGLTLELMRSCTHDTGDPDVASALLNLALLASLVHVSRAEVRRAVGEFLDEQEALERSSEGQL